MARKGIRMIQHTSPVKRETMGTTRVPRKTSWYTVDLMYEGVDRHLQFQNSTGIIYERVTEDTMYETVVHTPNEQELTRMSMTCPNCGAKALTHTVCTACGTYKGKVVSKKAEGYVEEAKEEVKEVKKAKKSAKKEEAAPEVEVKAEEKAEVVEEASEETPEA